MEMRHLRCFVAAAEELNFTRAAARLGMAQPPLTLHIRALEHEVGVALFVRLSRGVALTDAGQSLLGDARVILEQVGQATHRARLSASGVVGRIGVGFTVSASFHALVNGCLRTFRETYPRVEMQLSEARSTDLVHDLAKGRLDVAFVRPPLTLPAPLVMEQILEEAMVAAIPIGHRLADRRAVRLRDLAADPFILYPRASTRGLSDDVTDACNGAGFDPFVVQRAPQLASAINLVASSLGVSVVPACMRRSRTDAVRYIDIHGTPLLARLAVATRLGDTSAPAKNFLRLLRQATAGQATIGA